MHRIDGPGHSNNLFTEGDPLIPTPATTVTSAWLNAMQEEVAGVIEGAGDTLDKDDNTQLLAAIDDLRDQAYGGFNRATGRHVKYEASADGILHNSVYVMNETGALGTPMEIGGWGFVETKIHTSDDYGFQTVSGYAGNATRGRTWVRSRESGSWRPWVEISTAPVFAGGVLLSAGQSVPYGYLECNGTPYSRTTYAALFSTIGTVFGAGDGSTTFNVPDLRGEFIRGWDNGRGLDPGRVFGSAQVDLLRSHVHYTGSESTRTIQVDGMGLAKLGEGANFATSATGGTETRPFNVALMFCIKY